MTWVMLWPVIKKFGPYVLVVAVLFGVYAFGKHRGAEFWRARYDFALEARDQERASAVAAVKELEVVKDALDRQNEAYITMQGEHERQLDRVNATHRDAISRQARSYQESLDEARRRADELSERVSELSVAETCHEAWLELIR